jgi:hypothetical protein
MDPNATKKHFAISQNVVSVGESTGYFDRLLQTFTKLARK